MQTGGLNDGVVELVFTTSDPEYPFVQASREEDCRLELRKIVPRDGGKYAEFFSVTGTDPSNVLRFEERDGIENAHIVSRRDDGGLCEFVFEDECPVGDLAKRGAIPQTVVSEDGDGRIVAEVLPGYDVADVVPEVLDSHPDLDLVKKREKEQPAPLFSERELRLAVDEQLTARQREVLKTAFETGYYEQPRQATGEEIADDLGISSTTFSQHIRAAERNLLSLLFDDQIL